MSNLIKSVYFNPNPQEARVINSDDLVEDYIPDIYEKGQSAKDFAFNEFETAEAQCEEGQNFEDGLSVISMEDVVSQEREKLSEELKQEQEEILSQAKQEAEAMIAEANEQVEALKEMARSEGIAQGIEEGRAQAGQELDQMRQNLQEEYATRFEKLEEQEKNLEPAFADIIISLVRKLTGITCESKKDVILYLIGNALKNGEKTNQIIIRVSKGDMTRVSAKKNTFMAIAKDVLEFDIVEDLSLLENQCIIETDNKVIDCSLDSQLQNLEEHVKLLVY